MKTPMQVPLLDLKPQMAELKAEIMREIENILDSTQFVLGPKVEALEKAIAEYTGTSYAIGVSSGTDALLLALMALEVGPGDIVITTDFSFFATAGVVTRLNAQPVFVDIDPLSYNLDPTQLDDVLKRMTKDGRKKVKAIIPVHLYGQCADMAEILGIAERYHIPVIEDAAQAIGAEYQLNGACKRAGNLGTIGCFSFFPTKNLGGIGDGGMVVTNDPTLAEQMKIKRVHGAQPKYYHQTIGGNFRLDPIQAVALSIKLPHLQDWHRARQKNANNYSKYFQKANLPQVGLPHALYQEQGLTNYHIYNQFVIRVPKRDQLQKFLAEQHIATEIYYPIPFHLQKCFAYLGYKKADFPQSKIAAEEVLALPIYPELTEEMQTYVVQQIKEFFRN
ncbi:DegT/DnrJ/EryC1/StrS family aminotransferase [Deltaproteobacteria bacterium TL4]